MRIAGSAKLSSPVGPQEYSTCGQLSGGVMFGGTHWTVYGVVGPVMAATKIWRSGSGLRALMSEMNWLTGISIPESVSFDWQLSRVSVCAPTAPVASDGGLSGGCCSVVGLGPFGSSHRWP